MFLRLAFEAQCLRIILLIVRFPETFYFLFHYDLSMVNQALLVLFVPSLVLAQG